MNIKFILVIYCYSILFKKPCLYLLSNYSNINIFDFFFHLQNNSKKKQLGYKTITIIFNYIEYCLILYKRLCL